MADIRMIAKLTCVILNGRKFFFKKEAVRNACVSSGKKTKKQPKNIKIIQHIFFLSVVRGRTKILCLVDHRFTFRSLESGM